MTDRRLIEEWLPIAEIGIESDRERGASSALPPIYYLHTWWARRPLIISRAAVLASILPADADREKFIHVLGIHGDPVKARQIIERANKEKKKLDNNPFGYKRAFTYHPNESEQSWINETIKQKLKTVLILDPTAGGGSIPLESHRLGCTSIANDLNPVAAFILHATIIWPSQFNNKLNKEFQDLSNRFIDKSLSKYANVFQPPPKNVIINGLLWARTIPCPHCLGLVPLSPNWRVAPNGVGVKLKPEISNGPGSKGRICSFQIVKSLDEQSDGTVSGGNGTCPYPDCNRVISGDEIKDAAKTDQMGEQLYAVIYKKLLLTQTKSGKRSRKWVKDFRSPESEDYDEKLIQHILTKKLQKWDTHDTIPSEKFPVGTDNRPIEYGMPLWRDLFSPRQLLCHGIGVEVFQDLLSEDKKSDNLTNIRKAAYGYLAIALDTMLNYNSRLTTWHANRTTVGPTFARHDYGFSWSYAEMIPSVAGLGYEWAIGKTIECVKALLNLLRDAEFLTPDQINVEKTIPTVTCKSGDNLDHIDDNTIDMVIMDPPYYDNVMYSELSDFFYVWLKRTAGLVFPEMFRRNLTDKENEAVANSSKFTGQKNARTMAGQDYESRMNLIFKECRRTLKTSGIMTVMFMHKSTGAWNALATSIINAGFYITASWPINSEARGSLHIRDKAAAKSNILLVCRPRKEASDISYWEDVEPKVKKAVQNKILEFEKAGMRGIDIYLSSFGPALEEFSRNWPMSRTSPKRNVNDDLYSVTPEDALITARREVKDWRLNKLINSTPNKDLDSVTAFFVLAWDTFRSPKFPYDEALHLAKTTDIDLDKEIVGRFAKKEGAYIVLLDSQTRKNLTRQARIDSQIMLDALHYAADIGRKNSAESAIKHIESEHLDSNESFIAALEAVLEVLPPSSNHTQSDLKGDLKSASTDFDALFNIYRLKFHDKIDNPNQLQLG